MTDLSTEAPLSTTIDTDASASQAGAGQMAIAEPAAPKHETARESLEAVIKNEDRKTADAAKAEPKDDAPKDEQKAEPKKAEEHPAKTEERPEARSDTAEEAKTETDAEKSEREQTRQHVEPPKHWNDAAKDKFRNAPREVQQEVARMSQEGEQHRARSERYERIREFDELAHRNGRDLRDSLAKLNQIENVMKANPLAGLNQILMEIGPRKADGQAYSLFEIATHIVNQGQQGYTQAMQQGQQQVAQQQAEQQQRARQQEEQARYDDLLVNAIVRPFAEANPRYYELQDSIAFFLNSRMIDPNLSVPERLRLAYDMAERLNPPSNVTPIQSKASLESPDRRADPDDFSGSKSIRSAPGSVSEDSAEFEAKRGESVLDSVREAARRLKRA